MDRVVCVLLLLLCVAAAAGLPVVLWHGMGDNCCNPASMGRMERLIKTSLGAETVVRSIMIGANPEQDTLNGFFMNANDQIRQVCAQLASDRALQAGFHAVGFSQGGQFLRGLVQRCANITVVNLITLGAQHQGVFGFPRCAANASVVCEYVREALDAGAYLEVIQSHITQSNYWHDPLDETLYLRRCSFLPDINNALPVKNPSYKQRLLSLTHFVAVMFQSDQMVQPRESSHFGFYAPGQDQSVLPLHRSDLYLQDWLGLRELDQSGRLHLLSAPGDHLQFTDQWFRTTIIPYLSDQHRSNNI